MKKILILIISMFILFGCMKLGGEEMYIAIYDRNLNHITNVTDVKHNITERVFDLDTSNYSGISNIEIISDLIFVLCNALGKEIYSGYTKNLKQVNNYISFSGDDFKKIFNTEVILDYATELKTSPATLGELFRDVAEAVLTQNAESSAIVPIEIIYPDPDDDIYWIANYDMQYLTVNANKFLKTYLAYFGYFIDSKFDVVNKKIILEIKKNSEVASIRLDDFTHETTRSETLANKAIATLKYNNIIQDQKTWIRSDTYGDYYNNQSSENRTEEDNYDLTGYPSLNPNEYPLGYAVKVNMYDNRYQPPTFMGTFYYVNSVAATYRPNLPKRTYYLGNDNLIYETLIPQDKMVLPVITKVFEEEFFQTAQFNAVSELVNSRYNENIIITNTQTPVDISKYDLYTMLKVYDKNGLMVEMPLAEIERTNDGYKIKLGFKKTKFTEIVKAITEDPPIKSTGTSGGGAGLSEGEVHNIIESDVPGMIADAIEEIEIPAVMSQAEGNTGTAEIQRTINAANLKNTILYHSPAGARPANDVYVWAKEETLKVDDIPTLPQSKITNLVNDLNSKALKTTKIAGIDLQDDITASELRTGLSINNVNNTSDANKPVSTAQQTALDEKAPLESPTFSGNVTIPDLYVTGNLTTESAVDVEIGDRVITLQALLEAPNLPVLDAGLEINRGAYAKSSLIWNETSDRWEINSGGASAMATKKLIVPNVDGTLATVNDLDDIDIPDISIASSGSGNGISGIAVDGTNKHQINITKTDFTPSSRTIAGLPLTNNITAENLTASLDLANTSLDKQGLIGGLERKKLIDLYTKTALDTELDKYLPKRNVINALYQYRNVGGRYYASASNTGAVVIDLGTEDYMFNLKITIRSYNYLVEVMAGGYTYTTSTNWHIPRCFGNVYGNPLNVTFRGTGVGTNRYIVIGDTNTAWGGYLHISVDQANVGYRGVMFSTPVGVALQTTYPSDHIAATFIINNLVKNDDARLTDARTPTAHQHTEMDISASIATVTDATIYASSYTTSKTIIYTRSAGQTGTFQVNETTAPIGTILTLIRGGDGEIAITHNGANVYSHDGKRRINGKYQAVMLIQYAANAWYLVGAIKV